jgi:hypothetical protein
MFPKLINNDPIASSKSHRLYVKPEPFDGSSDWEEYFSHFINCAEFGRWTNQDKMLGLSANLRDIVYETLNLR